MSIGKYHGLVWSESGQLFGWGCKTLGLGLKIYTKVSLPSFRIIMMTCNKSTSHSQ